MRWCLLATFLGGVCLVPGLSMEARLPDSCCSRHEKRQKIEHGTVESLDVGHCRKACTHSRGNLLALLLGEDNSTDVTSQTCPADWLCRPARSVLQRVSTLRGVREMAAVHTCECVERPGECSRLEHSMVLNPGTPYETVLDVGACAGHCHKGGCQTMRSRTVSVAGPTGAQCHSVVDVCACVSPCYRQSYMEAVYDYNVTGADPMLKEVDVGRCAGACTGHRSLQCADPFHRGDGPCRSFLYSTASAECAASSFTVQRYTTRDGAAAELMVVQDCGCD